MKSQAQLQSPRERYRDALRREILDAAREAFVRYGYEGVSMRQLAEKVGCSHSNLYVHFKDKEALFDSLAEESFEQFSESLHRAAESTKRDDPIELLRKVGRAYVRFGLANPSAYEFAFIIRRPAHLQRKPHVAYERMRALVQRGIDEKRFRRIDADVASQALWAAAHGITSLLILRPTFPWADRDKVIGQVIDAAVAGLLA
jgi:AcrR family transcriptional regulator